MGSLRRANCGRALDSCGPFWPSEYCDGRLRRDPPQLRTKPIRTCQRSAGRSSLLRGTPQRRHILPMRRFICFEAGSL